MLDTARQLPLFSADDEVRERLTGFSVRESTRARRLSIKVFPRGRVEVVVPRRTRPAEVRAFVEENRDWIRRARDEFAADCEPEAFALPARIALPAIGRTFSVRYCRAPGQPAVRCRESANVLTVSGPVEDEQAVVAALRRWLTRLAKREYAPRLKALAALTGTPYSRMQVRMQRTCWGSRSARGTISLNLCLLFLAPELMRYLMIHELCHGRHMNHSRRFWRFVAQFEPDCRRLDRRLSDAWRDVPVWLGIC